MARTAKPLRYFLSASCLLALVSIQAKAQDAKIDSDARKALEAVAEVYRNLPAYADSGQLAQSVTIAGTERKRETPLTIALERPNKISVMYEGVTFLCDGKELFTASAALRKYRKLPAPTRITQDDVVVSPLGSVLLGNPDEPPATTVLTFLLDEKAVEHLLEGTSELRLEPATEPNTQLLVVKRPPRPELRLTIDTTSRLVKQAETRFNSAALEAASSDVKAMSTTWKAGAITTQSVDARRFHFDPAGYSAVQVAEATAKPDEKQGHKLLGQEAPDFRLRVLASGGKAQEVSKADLAGKVVILDFWATWCGPCREELPEIQKLCERLARSHAGKVRVLAVSQDREPADGKLRELVEKSLKELDVNLMTSPVAAVALDPEQAVGDAFGVEGIPTVFVLDGRGVIQAVHLGYRDGVGDELAEQVEALLEGKSLNDKAGESKLKDGRGR